MDVALWYHGAIIGRMGLGGSPGGVKYSNWMIYVTLKSKGWTLLVVVV